jgi:hypothetical protein
VIAPEIVAAISDTNTTAKHGIQITGLNPGATYFSPFAAITNS